MLRIESIGVTIVRYSEAGAEFEIEANELDCIKHGPFGAALVALCWPTECLNFGANLR